MKTIEVEDDVYAYLVSRTNHFGESATSVLRRELKLALTDGGGAATSTELPHELASCLRNPKLRIGSATDKFLEILGAAYLAHPQEFERVLSIKGRDRIYFARSRDDIAASGRSTQPLPIPGSNFWVMTNSPTPQKKKMLRQALHLLGYSEMAINEAANVIS